MIKRIVDHTGIALGIVVLIVTTVTGCGSGASPSKPPPAAPAEATPPEIPPMPGMHPSPGMAKPDPSGKRPKPVVVGGPEYNFGTTEVAQEFEHVFIVKNEGDADMTCRAGAPSCATCTSFKIDKEKVKPGDSLKATVKWHITNPNPEFRQFAPIILNGGEELKLYVVGKVVKRIVLEPSDIWNIGDLVEGKPTEFVATVTSALVDKFDIESVTASSPSLKITATPMPPEKLKELKLKCGYQLVATLEPNIAVGEFKDRASINVLTPKPISLKVDVKAMRTGPLKIFGYNYNPELAVFRLGDFDPTKEFVAKLTLFTRGIEEELKIEKLICLDKRISVEVKQDTVAKLGEGSKKYDLLIKVAGSDKAPPVYTPAEPLQVELVTNNAVIGSIKFKIFSSQLR